MSPARFLCAKMLVLCSVYKNLFNGDLNPGLQRDQLYLHKISHENTYSFHPMPDGSFCMLWPGSSKAILRRVELAGTVPCNMPSFILDAVGAGPRHFYQPSGTADGQMPLSQKNSPRPRFAACTRLSVQIILVRLEPPDYESTDGGGSLLPCKVTLGLTHIHTDLTTLWNGLHPGDSRPRPAASHDRTDSTIESTPLYIPYLTSSGLGPMKRSRDGRAARWDELDAPFAAGVCLVYHPRLRHATAVEESGAQEMSSANEQLVALGPAFYDICRTRSLGVCGLYTRLCPSEWRGE
ncbi:hypothetical protein SODALDRAFT_381474 [Sodiomyces alkalinus F11]|uniref:Uncharacterized protein n=1 Tax=Sodiomyces alkalinus (strain CBS 110278 / VKM F-3762 / F11) TaxID=1314773 RepID=A0A3N2PLR7_SODAK|nr:hypothetical protein SODALDRAFT_381474 [Sodiomyces alkalinus F11]ROT35296.1 hypothetical protein SODALDRAFT_381474 [Sodiomyces alkalinus F11]